MRIRRDGEWIETNQLQSGDFTMELDCPRKPGLWLHWCDVDGYSTAWCSCSAGWTWFRNWSDADKAAKVRHA